MNLVKKILGLVWMVLAPLGLAWLLKIAYAEIQEKPMVDTYVQWSVFVIVFLPIIAGFFIFGWYSFKGEYR